MKICFFSDIHGNNYAFDEFINYSLNLDIDQYVLCGDIFGYYYGQNDIISKLRNIVNLYSIKGNHDINYLNICLKLESEKIFIDKYGSSYKNIAKKISVANHNFIENMADYLELNFNDIKIGIFHGSPINHLSGRVYPDTEITEFDIYKNYDYIILGHTHYRMLRNLGLTVIINPGSIGQPRDKNGSSFATLTLPSGEIQFYQIKWEKSKLVSEIKKNDKSNQKLIDILFRDEVSL